MSTSPEVMETDQPIHEFEDNENEEQDSGEEPQEEESDGEAEEGGEEEDEDEDIEDKEETIPEPITGSRSTSKKRTKKEVGPLTREPGKLILPFSRVQKIIKADKDIPIVAKDAVFLISLATESFIMELAAAARRVAENERRLTVQQKDIATVVRKADEFMFLEDIIPWLGPEPEKKRGKPTAKERSGKQSSGPTLHNHFSISKKKTGESGVDVIMNEDGTMSAIGDD